MTIDTKKLREVCPELAEIFDKMFEDLNIYPDECYKNWNTIAAQMLKLAEELRELRMEYSKLMDKYCAARKGDADE